MKRNVESDIVGGADANKASLGRFEEGLARCISQHNAGLANSFKTKEEFLDHLKRLEQDA